MKSLILSLAFFTLLCTGVRAQIVYPDPLKFDKASIAFIKGSESRYIDSIAINTSTDKVPYGFAFPADTLLLDIKLLLPVDELTIETFARGRSFGKSTCWVDPPSADVYLSVTAGQMSIDSVGLSEVDKWYRKKVQTILALQGLDLRKFELARTISIWVEDLVVLRFVEAYLGMPNLTQNDAYELWRTLADRSDPVRAHPSFAPLLAHAKLLGSQKPAFFKKLEFQDAKRRKRALPEPESEFFLLEIYQRDNPVSQKNHDALMESPAIDSVLQKMSIISLTSEDSPALWSLYVKDRKFKWLHGLHVPNKKVPSLDRWAIFPNSTYLLVNKKFNVIGAYPSLERMAAGMSWHSQGGKW
ncbi:MAG: hypothetical protein AB8H12_21255 [Lewinella sp.]